MPSLWKKRKGNRISRLMSDWQTPPKRGETLVVESGFPTSLVDFFVKNREKFRKLSKKHHISKYQITSTRKGEDHDYPYRVVPLVSHPHVTLSKRQVPISLVDEKSHENGAHTNNSNNFFVEEILVNDDVESNCFFSFKNVFWLCFLMGIIIIGVALYYKSFVWGIILGALLLLSLEYVEDSIFPLFKHCENWVLLACLKGAFVVGVTLYTKRFFVGIIIGALLLFVVEYIGKVLLPYFIPCEDVISELRGWEDEGLETKGGSNRVVRFYVKDDIYKEDGNGFLSKGETEQEDRNDIIMSSEFKSDNENTIVSKRENEQGYEDSTLLNNEVQNKPTCGVEVLEVWRNQLNGHIIDRDFDMPMGRTEKGDESSEIVHHDGKAKKGKKFWKKLVPKHIRNKKKNNHKKEFQAIPDYTLVSSIMELEEEDEQDYDYEFESDEESSTSISSPDKEEEEGMKHSGVANKNYNETFQIDSGTIKSNEMIKED